MVETGSPLPGSARAAGAIRVVESAGRLDYGRYLRLQEGLRARRRELLIFCEHPPTLTAGVQSAAESLLLPEDGLRPLGIAHLRIGRGGDYTAHEPGQCVIYPHLDLWRRELAVSRYFALLLEVTAEALRSTWGIHAESRPKAPGLYTPDGLKIASIGIMFKRFFTSFGVALNVGNDLSTFRWIRPCGDPNLQVTSVARCGADPTRVSDFRNQWTQVFRERLSSNP